MTGLVLDASTALAWCFEDEADPATDDLIARIAVEGAVVPGNWHLEVANGLVAGERRGRITRADGAAFAEMIEELPILVDASTAARALHETVGLARDMRLSSYDAAYLELASRLGLPLATGDRALRIAAERIGVALAEA